MYYYYVPGSKHYYIDYMCTFYPAPLNGFEIESQFGIDENCELNLPPLNSVAEHATIKSGNSFPPEWGMLRRSRCVQIFL